MNSYFKNDWIAVGQNILKTVTNVKLFVMFVRIKIISQNFEFDRFLVQGLPRGKP